jgi:hypothetical protein
MGDAMRGLVGLIVGTGMAFAASSAWAQMYDPNYPVCAEVHDGDGTRYECFFTSMEQCKQGYQGMPASCFNNPRYVAPKAEAAPAPEPGPAPSPIPVKKKKK